MTFSCRFGERGWLAVGLLLVVSLMAMSSAPIDPVEAAGETVTPTATPPYVWRTVDSTRGTILSLDPYGKNFKFEAPRETPIAVTVPNMVATQRRVTWQWSDKTRPCDPAATATPSAERCYVAVWGSVDRVRQTAKVTYYRRTTTGKVTHNLSVATPFAIPRGPDPIIQIQDFRFVPKKIILTSRKARVTFQNESQLVHDIVLDRVPTTDITVCANKTTCVDFGRVSPGKYNLTPFPVIVNTPTPTTGDPEDPDVWQTGTYTYHCEIHTFMTGTIVIP
jgi:plastocyanin